MRLLYSISLLLLCLILKMVLGDDGNSLVNSAYSLSGKELKMAFHEVGLYIYFYFYIQPSIKFITINYKILKCTACLA